MRKFRKDNLNKMIKLLQENDVVKRKDLCRELNVSITTIQIYINILRNFGFKIESKVGRSGGLHLIN